MPETSVSPVSGRPWLRVKGRILPVLLLIGARSQAAVQSPSTAPKKAMEGLTGCQFGAWTVDVRYVIYMNRVEPLLNDVIGRLELDATVMALLAAVLQGADAETALRQVLIESLPEE